MRTLLTIHRGKLWFLILFFEICISFLIIAFSPISSHTTKGVYDDPPPDDFCLTCHQQQGMELKFLDKTIDATINPTEFGLSVHSEEGINCVDCHSEISDYPHPAISQKNSRDFSLALLTICKDCHEEQAEKVQDSVHQNAFTEGNKEAAVCTDCHNPHTQKRLTGKSSGELTNAARLRIPQVCAQCHAKIYETYKVSVHGNALTQENNTDVPTCIDCHGVHNIPDPGTSTFRNSTPYLCAKCHADQEIMGKYGISTKVLDTYVADFHGTTVKLFTEEYPDQPTNKPVCTDCHGIHEISKWITPKLVLPFARICWSNASGATRTRLQTTLPRG